ncbi:hypothetical protein EDB19DRAFT_2036448 [Suillus lakei]|nr:hypothetical protein EDB19DRAFT_2036448 [Suillus lakei]
MHQALLISDVLLEIFAYVNQISYTKKASTRKSDLVALATTCKAFYEPAMDLLWAGIGQLEPLLGCVTRLHPLIYRSGRVWDGRYTWAKGVEPLSTHEICQFMRHSARIRSLDVSSEHLVKLLSAIPIVTGVFPRLRLLCWRLSTAKYLDLFLPRTLRQCYLWTINDGLQSIVTRCTALELLSVHTVDASPASELSLLSDRVCSCKQLVSLSCPLLDWAAWKHLSNLPTLLRVDIEEARGVPPWPLERDIINFSPFRNVTALSFFLLHGAAYIITVLQHSQFPSLKEFEINLEVLSSAEAEQLFCALSHCKACQTLEKLAITFDKYEAPPGKSLSVIPHLLCFTQLRILRLTCDDTFIYLNDDLLLEAMSTWPHIHILEIEDSGLRSSPVTFRALSTGLRLCPHLNMLRVAISTEDIDIDPDTEPIHHPSLRSLKLEASEFVIANSEALARIIFTWFPCIDNVSGSAEYWDDWDAVNMHLTSLRARCM